MQSVIQVLYYAERDIQLAQKWYEKKSPELGKKFKLQIVNAIDSLLDPKIEYGSVYNGLSRIFVKRFPYVIYYRRHDTQNRIIVYAILHEKQNRDSVLKGRV